MLPVLFNPEIRWPSRLPVLGRLGRDVDRMFDRFFAPTLGLDVSAYGVDVWEDEGHVYIAADVPGFTKEDLEISVENGVLTLAGERKDESECKDGDYHLRERRFGKFERRFRLPEDVNHESVQAGLKDGVLTITLDRREESKPKKIEVEESK